MAARQTRATEGLKALSYGAPNGHHAIQGKFDGLIAIPLGAFGDPCFASPAFSVWEQRKYDWVEIFGRHRRVLRLKAQPPHASR